MTLSLANVRKEHTDTQPAVLILRRDRSPHLFHEIPGDRQP